MANDITARADIMTAVADLQLAWAAYPLLIETENRDSIDQATQSNPYLQVTINMLSGEQMDMADHPTVRQRGQILLCAVVKDGMGTAGAAALLAACDTAFSLKRLGCVQCLAFELQRAKPVTGLYYMPAIINFWYLKVTA